MYKQGNAIKIALIKTGKTQTALANCLGISRQAVSDWACEKRFMTLQNAEKIAECLDMKLSEFVALGE